MKNHIKILILSLQVLLFSCNNSVENFSNIINVDLSEIKEYSASSFVKDCKIIRLETGDDFLINDPLKISYHNNKIYILDVMRNSIFIFHENGKYVNKLSNKGQGPGQYIDINDFFIHDENLYVLDNANKTILCYDSILNFTHKITLNKYAKQFIIDENSIWIENVPQMKSDDYRFSRFNTSGVLLGNYLETNTTKEEYGWGGMSIFYSKGIDNYISPALDNLIYSIKRDSLEPIYEINFGNKTFPKDLDINTYDFTDGRYVVKQNFYCSDDYFVFDYIYNAKKYFHVYNKKDSTVMSGTVNNDFIETLKFSPRWGSGNFMIESISPYIIYNDYSFLLNNESLKDLKVEDNPVVILYSLVNE